MSLNRTGTPRDNLIPHIVHFFNYHSVWLQNREKALLPIPGPLLPTIHCKTKYVKIFLAKNLFNIIIINKNIKKSP